MSDPLSISASIIALIQVSAKVVEFVSNLSGTPKIASRVTSELTAMDILLRRLQALVKDLDSAFSEEIVGVKSYAVLEDLVIVLTGCVCAYAELDVIVGKLKRRGMAALDSAIRYAKWALMEGDISTIISNLQNYKSSLTVMLALFVCGSLPEVFRHLDDLSQSTAHILKSHRKLEQRIQESISESSNSSIDTESIRSTSSFRSIASFRRELLKTRVYRLSNSNHSTSSFQNKGTSQSKGTFMSNLTRASMIAVINLPINVQELHSGFLPVSSALYDIHSSSDEENSSPPTTSLDVISIEELLREQEIPLNQRLSIGMALAKSMPRLLGIWPEKWGTRDIYFRRIPSYVNGISDSNELVRILRGYQVSFSKPLLRPVFNPDHIRLSRTAAHSR